MPDDARVCDCNNVSKAQIIEAVLQGARSVRAVCDATRASTGCGSCRPEVEAIVALACERVEPGARNLELAGRTPEPNKIERIKQERDGLDVADDLQKFARDGWESISDSDRERLKWLGVFFRRQTPGRFMMRIRMPNGITNAAQLRAISELSRECGTGFVDITTRQQIQLRGFAIGDVPHIWERLHGGRARVAADRHGQHPQRRRMSGRRHRGRRALRRVARGSRVHECAFSRTRRSRTCRGNSTSRLRRARQAARTRKHRTSR